jgi:hypothetical protein
MPNIVAISLHVLVGIQMDNMMVVYVTIKGQCLLALLETGSTHNFMAMMRLGLTPTGGEQLRVTVTNGDHLRCVGVARDVPVTIAGEPYWITCIGIDLGCFDFILSVDFLRILDLGSLGEIEEEIEGVVVPRQGIWPARVQIGRPRSDFES